MKLMCLLGSSALLAPLVSFLLLTGAVAPLWLLVPVLLLAIVMGTSIAAQQWLRVIGIVALRLLLVMFALSLLVLSLVALATIPAPHWILWAIIGTGLLALVVGLRPLAPIASPGFAAQRASSPQPLHEATRELATPSGP